MIKPLFHPYKQFLLLAKSLLMVEGLKNFQAVPFTIHTTIHEMLSHVKIEFQENVNKATMIPNILEIIKRRLAENDNFHVVGQDWTLADICAFVFLTEIDPSLLDDYMGLKE